MRKAQMNRIVDSDVDLVVASSRRVRIEMVEVGVFRITSKLRFYNCSEAAYFVGRYLRRKLPGMTFIRGNCSAPTGYYWSPMI